MRISDWSSDVCSSDLRPDARPAFGPGTGSCSWTRVRIYCALPSSRRAWCVFFRCSAKGRGVYLCRSDSDAADRSEEHTSELQSLMRISYAVFCLKKKKNTK